jgi:hypothetical protein
MRPENNRPAGNTVSNAVKRLCCELYAALCATTVKTCVLYIAGLLLLAFLFALMGMISSRQGSQWSEFFFNMQEFLLLEYLTVTTSMF